MKKHQLVSIALWLAMLWTQNAMSDESQKLTIDTPEGTFPISRTTAEPVPQQITVISDDQRETFRRLGELGPEFVRQYLPNSSVPDLKDYDQAFRAWQLSDSRLYSNQHVVEVLGAVLGNRLVDDLVMEWVVVDDEYGTDYAVRSKKYEVMTFPFSTVLKRVEDDEYDFMFGVYYAVKDRVESGEYAERHSEN